MVDSVRIAKLEWTPYLGLNTLLVRSLAQNIENGHEYKPLVLFKGVIFHETPTPRTVNIVASDYKHYFFEPLRENEVLVKCECGDYYWRFNYFNSKYKSHFGSRRAKYESKGGLPANPSEMPGICKHLMVLEKTLDEAGVI